MYTEEIKIPTDGRPIEAFTMYQDPKPGKALLILPGRGYTTLTIEIQREIIEKVKQFIV